MEIFLLITLLIVTLYLCLDIKETSTSLYTNCKELYTYDRYNDVKSNNSVNKLATMLLIRNLRDIFPNNMTKEFICDNGVSLYHYYECHLTYYLERDVIRDIHKLKNHQCIILRDSPMVYIVKKGCYINVYTIFI